MKWFGNTLREPGNNITFSVLEWNLQGSRGRGCLKQSRRHTFQDELDKNNITWREAERTTKIECLALYSRSEDGLILSTVKKRQWFSLIKKR